LPNVVFLRMLIDHLPDYFEKDEVDEIWITFPDPYTPKSKAKQVIKKLSLDGYFMIGTRNASKIYAMKHEFIPVLLQ